MLPAEYFLLYMSPLPLLINIMSDLFLLQYDSSLFVITLSISRKPWTHFSLNQPIGSTQSLICVCVCHFLWLFKTSFHKGQKYNRPIAKRFLMEKLRKEVGLRFNNFGSEMVKNRHAITIYFLVFATHLHGRTTKLAWTNSVRTSQDIQSLPYVGFLTKESPTARSLFCTWPELSNFQQGAAPTPHKEM